MFIASQVSARDCHKGEMSKLARQQALPRRRPFKIIEPPQTDVLHATDIHGKRLKPARKAKKAKKR